MTAPILRLEEGVSGRSPRRRKETPPLTEIPVKKVPTVYLVIRTMSNNDTMIEQIMSAHPSYADAEAQMEISKESSSFGEYRIQPFPVTRVLRVVSPIIPSSSGELKNHPSLNKEKVVPSLENNSKREDEDTDGDL